MAGLKLIYVDQNIAIDLRGAQPGSDEEEFLSRTKAGRLKVVLSSAHHLEAARAPHDRAAREIAEFFDVLRPYWLRERIALQKREIRAYLDNKAGQIDVIDAICRSVSEMASEVCGHLGWAAIMSSSELVAALRKDLRARQALHQAYKINDVGFARNVEDLKAGRLNPREQWKSYMRGLRKVLGLTSDLSRLEKAPLKAFRSITVEFKIAVENWQRGTNETAMVMSTQRLNDAMHAVVALPYVEYLISRDKRLINLIDSVRKKLRFKTAKPVGSLAEFLKGAT